MYPVIYNMIYDVVNINASLCAPWGAASLTYCPKSKGWAPPKGQKIKWKRKCEMTNRSEKKRKLSPPTQMYITSSSSYEIKQCETFCRFFAGDNSLSAFWQKGSCPRHTFGVWLEKETIDQMHCMRSISYLKTFHKMWVIDLNVLIEK